KEPGEEGETRAEAAMKFWTENWFRSYPKSGKGQFVYHHHFRGLNEDEIGLSEEELLNTKHSLHGDLRFQVDDEKLWGFTVFTGTTEDVKKAKGCRLCNIGRDKLQGTFKLYQPIEWLHVAEQKPYVSRPSHVGATAKKYAKFFMVDKGTYEIGVWREHFFEVFLHGKKLKGRYIITYAPVGGRRIWLISKPEDQRPYADTHKKGQVIKELKQKGQKWLIWAKPGCKPQLIDVEKWEFKGQNTDLSKELDVKIKLTKLKLLERMFEKLSED
ncbi:MAG: hypothetical protein ACTSUK_05855, partial [Promethearchaeota archaeon]